MDGLGGGEGQALTGRSWAGEGGEGREVGGALSWSGVGEEVEQILLEAAGWWGNPTCVKVSGRNRGGVGDLQREGVGVRDY